MRAKEQAHHVGRAPSGWAPVAEDKRRNAVSEARQQRARNAICMCRFVSKSDRRPALAIRLQPEQSFVGQNPSLVVESVCRGTHVGKRASSF